jgi:kynureninase
VGVSLCFKAAFDDHGIVTDTREPDIIRVSPAPLFNTFKDVFKVVLVLDSFLQ